MNRPDVHSDHETRITLERRLRRLGMVALSCAESGEVQASADPDPDWLTELFLRSPMFRGRVQELLREWDDPACGIREVLPGLWIVAQPVNSRRRRTGFNVTVIPTAEFVDSEQLSALCQAARQDVELCRKLLAQLPPIPRTEVDRFAELVRSAFSDHFELAIKRSAVENFGQQLAESYEEINLLYTIIRSMTVVQQPSRFIAIAAEELLATLPYRWIGALMAADQDRLKRLADRFIVAGEPGHPTDELRELVGELLTRAEPDCPLVLEPGGNPEHERYAKLGRTVLLHPVSSEDQVIGLLVAGEKHGDDTAASSVDMKLLGATASHMAIFIKNAALYDDLNTMFLGTLEALTASIDAKDRYTCGHSRRVADLTQQLARAVGLDEYTVGRTHIAGLVHDVGKIGVPEAVLLKPGKLNDEEFDWIRRHPEMGYRILKDIPQLKDILPGVLYHHERWDGRGYPRGLRGDEIPMVARLIALADSFDAMSSTRTYRAAMNREEVLEEIRRSAGTQFDPDLAPVFVGLDFTRYDELVIEHSANEAAADPPQGEAA